MRNLRNLLKNQINKAGHGWDWVL